MATSTTRPNGREGWAWAVLGLATVAYVALAMYLTRGATFTFDELTWLVDSDGFGPGAILEPHYGHPIAITRLIYAGMLASVGPDELVIRLSMIAAVAASAWLLHALLRPRIGAVAALAPSILVLFLGSTSEPLLPSVMPFPQATAFGLGALLLLERRDRAGDLGACALLVLSVASLEIGLGFVAAAAVIVGLEPGRVRRAWIPVVPAVLFAGWWIWARQFDESLATASNILLMPNYAADSLATAISSLSGVRDLGDGAGDRVSLDWGRVIAPAVVALVLWRCARVGVTRHLLGFIASLLVLWVGFTLGAGPFRTPDTDRYAFAVAIAVVLIVGEALREARIGRGVIVGLLAAMAFALPGNLAQMRTIGASVRESSASVDAGLSVIELERAYVSPDYNAGRGSFLNLTTAGDYLQVVDRYGSLASPPSELPARSPSVRAEVDLILIEILRPRVRSGAESRPSECTLLPAGERTEVPLPAGGAVLRSTASGMVGLRRYGDEAQTIAGALRPADPARLRIPTDSAAQPWLASIETRGRVTVCAPGSAAG